MLIKQTKDLFKVIKWSYKSHSKLFRSGTKVKVTQFWHLELNGKHGIQDDNAPVIELTVKLMYSIKGFLDFHAQDVFYVYDHKNTDRAFDYCASAINILYQKMAQEFEKKKRNLDFNSPLPEMSHSTLQEHCNRTVQFLQDYHE